MFVKYDLGIIVCLHLAYRRSSRDIVERGSDINYLRQSHEERRIQYEVFMHPYSERFDIIIKTSDEEICLEKNTFEFKCK